jgi:hypothetical protein
LPPGARGRGRQKRVVAAKEGGDKYDNYDICPRAPETLAPPLRRRKHACRQPEICRVFRSSWSAILQLRAKRRTDVGFLTVVLTSAENSRFDDFAAAKRAVVSREDAKRGKGGANENAK